MTTYSIGYGDITPINIYEKLWVTLFMIVGSMLFSYTISTLSLIFSENETFLKVEFKKKKSLFKKIIKEYKIPLKLKISIKNTIKQQHHKNKDYYRCEFLSSLPSNIIKDLSMVMYKNTIENHKFFKNQSQDFILYVLPLLKFHMIFRRDILISVGEITQEMYLILQGNLSFHLGENYESLEIWQYGKNEYYGDLLLQLSEPSPYEIRCKSKQAEILILTKTNFLKVKNEFNSEIFQKMEENYNDFNLIVKRRELYIKLFSKSENSPIFKKKILQLQLELFDQLFLDYYYNNLDLNQLNLYVLKKEFKLAKRIFKKKNCPSIVKKTNKLSISSLNVHNNLNKFPFNTLENKDNLVSKKIINNSFNDENVLNKKNIMIEEEFISKPVTFLRTMYNENPLNDFDNLIENKQNFKNIRLKNNLENDNSTKEIQYKTLDNPNHTPNITLKPNRSSKNFNSRRKSHFLINSNKINKQSFKQHGANNMYNQIMKNFELMDNSVMLNREIVLNRRTSKILNKSRSFKTMKKKINSERRFSKVNKKLVGDKIKSKFSSDLLNQSHDFISKKKDVLLINDESSFSSNDQKNNKRFNITNLMIERTEDIHLIPLDSHLKKGSFHNLETFKVEDFSFLTKEYIFPIPNKSNHKASKVSLKINNDVENFSKKKNLSSNIRNTYRFSHNLNINKKKQTFSKYIISYLNQNEIAFKIERIVDKKLDGLLNLLMNYKSIK